MSRMVFQYILAFGFLATGATTVLMSLATLMGNTAEFNTPWMLIAGVLPIFVGAYILKRAKTSKWHLKANHHVALLEQYTRSAGFMNAKEAARRLDISTGEAQHLLDAMAKEGMLEMDSDEKGQSIFLPPGQSPQLHA